MRGCYLRGGQVAAWRNNNLLRANAGNNPFTLRAQGRLGWVFPEAVPSLADAQTQATHRHVLALPSAIAARRSEIYGLIDSYIEEVQRAACFVGTVIANGSDIVSRHHLIDIRAFRMVALRITCAEI